jgi:hypothetical protein
MIYKKKPLFLILDYQHMNSFDIKEIIIPKDLEIENGVLGLERDVYLSIFVKGEVDFRHVEI